MIEQACDVCGWRIKWEPFEDEEVTCPHCQAEYEACHDCEGYGEHGCWDYLKRLAE